MHTSGPAPARRRCIGSALRGYLRRESALWPLLAGAIPLVLTVVVYWPLLGNWFWADDFVCMLSIINDGFLRFVLRPFGGHNLFVRNLVFYVFWQLFGLHAAPYFWAMLLTHLVNVWLLFRVLRGLTASAMLACVGATLWGTSPIAAGVLAWYAVFGHALVATFLLVVLDRLVPLARSGAPVPTRTAWSWYVMLLLGSVTFGVGIGVALAFPVVLFAMVPAAWRQPRVRAAYLALPLVTLALYVAYRRLYPVFIEPLSLEELNNEPPALAALPRTLAGVAALVGYSASDYTRSFFWATRAGYPDRASWPVVGGVAAGLGLLCWRGSGATRRAAVAMVSLCLGVYLAIALGRIGFLGGNLITLATQQRYHYVGAIPIVTLVCLAVQEVGRIGWLARVPRMPLLLAALALWAWGFKRSTFPIDLHAGPKRVVDTALSGIDAEVSRSPAEATVYLESGANSQTMLGFVMRDVDFPGRAAIFLLTHHDDRVDGRTVRFVIRDPQILAHYRQRPESPLARLMVSPQEAGR
jgi:hypothetical protein